MSFSRRAARKFLRNEVVDMLTDELAKFIYESDKEREVEAGAMRDMLEMLANTYLAGQPVSLAIYSLLNATSAGEEALLEMEYFEYEFAGHVMGTRHKYITPILILQLNNIDTNAFWLIELLPSGEKKIFTDELLYLPTVVTPTSKYDVLAKPV